YDVWSEQGERITTLEPMAYRYVVRQRTLVDLEGLRQAAGERETDLLSVVLAVDASDSVETITTGVHRLLETAAGRVEVVVVDARTPDESFIRLHAELARLDGVTVHRLSQQLPMEVARNAGVGHTPGDAPTSLPAPAGPHP